MSDRKFRVAIVFGGRSGEHEVSCKSAASILTHLDRERYEIIPVLIGKDGVWTSADSTPEFSSIDEALRWQRNAFSRAGDGTHVGSILSTMGQLAHCDVVFPAMHGPFGEDGTIQALFSGLDVPLVGNGVAASALAMDKEYTKKIASSLGITVSDGVVLRRGQDDITDEDRDRLGLPVFVKPAREGSSIGMSKVDDWINLPEALRQARKSDHKVLVEAAVRGREIDIGVLERPGGDLELSAPMEVFTPSDAVFLDYQAKYGESPSELKVPTDVDPATIAGLGQDALRMFRALDCAGLLRADFFVRTDGVRVLNEVNTLPGFTSASLYPQMWQNAGLEYGELLDVLIDTAWWHATTG